MDDYGAAQETGGAGVPGLDAPLEHALGEVAERILPLMAECASGTPPRIEKRGRGRRGGDDEAWERAELCRRLLELCLRGAEARREYLWGWLDGQGGSLTS